MGRDETRVYVGNLPPDCREKDLEDIFAKYGKVRFIDIKGGRGPAFAFVEFDDARERQDTFAYVRTPVAAAAREEEEGEDQVVVALDRAVLEAELHQNTVPVVHVRRAARHPDLQDQSLAARRVIEDVEELGDVNGTFLRISKSCITPPLRERDEEETGNDKRWSKAHTAAYEIGLIQWNQLRNHGQYKG
ncbi:hypothetical protein TELCIR_07660 [Teladorsagia circumcincta]|uniref:RRM domain-containing protein n=1 Tax=Teladorsagia circumcincta TaxID=45464 RepID=A0A2G9ULX9_TELCI|nr:hypothetical protein TELCIR_07660 [Teladorsagia circumcincta]